MSKKKQERDTVSLRVRLPFEVIDRIDRLVGEAGRQKYIRDSVIARLEEELPPIVNEVLLELEDLKTRVSYLERIRDTSVYRGDLNESIKTKVCRDELDRKIIAHIIKSRGSTTPELAEQLLGDSQKRRTIHDRLEKLNKRAEKVLGNPILRYERGELDGKRGAWWAIDPDDLMT
ncbi:MAG: hypothetical protein ACFFED_08665 [Candidatus Thorarchaeota archaeon]